MHAICQPNFGEQDRMVRGDRSQDWGRQQENGNMLVLDMKTGRNQEGEGECFATLLHCMQNCILLLFPIMKAVSKGHGLKQYIRDKDTQGQTFAHGEMSDTFCL